jgi:predicted transcriptional regulator
MIRSSRLTIFWKFGSKAPVEKSKLEPRERIMTVSNVTDGLGLTEADIKVLITLIEKSSKQQLDEEIRG